MTKGYARLAEMTGGTHANELDRGALKFQLSAEGHC